MALVEQLAPSGYLRTLPPRARTIVKEHRRRLLRDVGGRVLDLGGDPGHRDLFPTTAQVVTGAELAADGTADTETPFDHVVSILHLSTVDDPEAEVARAKRLLAPDGALVFLEPAADTGLGGRLQVAVAPVVGRLAGWRPDRDVVALLRDARFIMSTVVRTPLPRHLWPLTDLVEGRAHHREHDLEARS